MFHLELPQEQENGIHPIQVGIWKGSEYLRDSARGAGFRAATRPIHAATGIPANQRTPTDSSEGEKERRTGHLVREEGV